MTGLIEQVLFAMMRGLAVAWTEFLFARAAGRLEGRIKSLPGKLVAGVLLAVAAIIVLSILTMRVKY